MNLQSRATVFAAIGGMLALMGGIVYYASLDNTSLESVEFLSGSLEVTDVDEIAERARIKVTFDVRNPSETVFTIPTIIYHINAGGQKLVSGEYSTVDVAMPGRVVFTTNSVIPLTSTAYMIKSDSNSEMYDMLISGGFTEYAVTGIVTVESAWSIVERDFEVELGTR